MKIMRAKAGRCSSLRALRTVSQETGSRAHARGTSRGLQGPVEKQELLRWEEVVWSGKSTKELITFEVCLTTVQILGAGGHGRGASQVQELFPQRHRVAITSPDHLEKNPEPRVSSSWRAGDRSSKR